MSTVIVKKEFLRNNHYANTRFRCLRFVLTSPLRTCWDSCLTSLNKVELRDLIELNRWCGVIEDPY
jgi:hypothetical protein